MGQYCYTYPEFPGKYIGVEGSLSKPKDVFQDDVYTVNPKREVSKFNGCISNVENENIENSQIKFSNSNISQIIRKKNTVIPIFSANLLKFDCFSKPNPCPARDRFIFLRKDILLYHYLYYVESNNAHSCCFMITISSKRVSNVFYITNDDEKRLTIHKVLPINDQFFAIVSYNFNTNYYFHNLSIYEISTLEKVCSYAIEVGEKIKNNRKRFERIWVSTDKKRVFFHVALQKKKEWTEVETNDDAIYEYGYLPVKKGGKVFKFEVVPKCLQVIPKHISDIYYGRFIVFFIDKQLIFVNRNSGLVELIRKVDGKMNFKTDKGEEYGTSGLEYLSFNGVFLLIPNDDKRFIMSFTFGSICYMQKFRIYNYKGDVLYQSDITARIVSIWKDSILQVHATKGLSLVKIRGRRYYERMKHFPLKDIKIPMEKWPYSKRDAYYPWNKNDSFTQINSTQVIIQTNSVFLSGKKFLYDSEFNIIKAVYHSSSSINYAMDGIIPFSDNYFIVRRRYVLKDFSIIDVDKEISREKMFENVFVEINAIREYKIYVLMCLDKTKMPIDVIRFVIFPFISPGSALRFENKWKKALKNPVLKPKWMKK